MSSHSYRGSPFCSLCRESKRISLSKCFLFPIIESNSQGKQGKRKKKKKKMPRKFLHIFQDPLVTKIGFFSSCRCLYRHRCCNCCCCKAAVSGMRFLSGHSQEEDDWQQQQQKAGYVLEAPHPAIPPSLSSDIKERVYLEAFSVCTQHTVLGFWLLWV